MKSTDHRPPPPTTTVLYTARLDRWALNISPFTAAGRQQHGTMRGNRASEHVECNAAILRLYCCNALQCPTIDIVNDVIECRCCCSSRCGNWLIWITRGAIFLPSIQNTVQSVAESNCVLDCLLSLKIITPWKTICCTVFIPRSRPQCDCPVQLRHQFN